MTKIAIIGLGLIGGSLGLALKRSRLRDAEIIGFSRSVETREKARKAGAIDRAASDARDAAKDAAIVIVATPIPTERKTMEEIAPVLADKCVVTDVASTKGRVMKWAEELLPAHVSFVGGHPMAGKELSGIDAAEAALFEGKPYCIVPSPRADETAVNAVVGIAELVGATPLFMDAEEHDSYVAAISHLPLVVSTALFSLVRESAAWPEMSRLASSGFRDVTRLASGSPKMSEDICSTNRENVVHWLDRMVAEIRKYRGLIEGDDEEALLQAFAKAKRERDEFVGGGKAPRGAGHPVEAGISVSDLLVGRWATQRTREIMKALEKEPPSQRQRE
ncbi:MAG: prephenate dehydrogenase/arogenate dehydrogenase family protein [Dehalococcoidia bacterium]